MRRSSLFRPQAIVVVLVALVLFTRGEVRFIPRDAVEMDTDEQIAAATEPTLPPTVGVIPTPPPATPSPTPTPTPTLTPAPTPTPAPSPTPEPTPTPSPTAEPVPTERPPAPPGVDPNAAVVITQPNTGRQEIAITFDAGDGRGHTLEILDILDRYGVAATFGVTGEWATANPDLLQEIVARGHQVINHGYTHQSFTGASNTGVAMTPDQMRSEVLNTEQAIWENGNRYEVKGFFRFPYGDYNAEALAVLKEVGYDYSIWWGCDGKAWMGSTAEQIVQECGGMAAPGLIVLLHVDPDADLAALPQLIELYQGQGYTLVTVEQLMQP